MFWLKTEPIVVACQKWKEQRISGWNMQFQEIYLLTHPYYHLSGTESFFHQYHDVLGESIAAVKKRGLRALGILTLEGDERYEFPSRNPVQKHLHQTLARMQKVFWDTLHVRIQTEWYYEEWVHKLPLILHPQAFVTARWIWWNRCVLTTLEDFSFVHGMQEERAILALGECRFPNEDNFPLSKTWAFTVADLRKLWKLRVDHPKSN